MSPSLVHGWTRRRLPSELEDARAEIAEITWNEGLRFCETVFEMCSFDEINMLASYGGFPVRYPHWRFGMEYLRMKTGYEWGLQKIYEMVINTDPAYAYLLDNNTVVDQKLVMAHVYGHVDFFQNNAWFKYTNRKMLDEMANHATRIRRYIDRFGLETVESFIDACLSLENLIDPMRPHMRQDDNGIGEDDHETETTETLKLPSKSYMDRYINPPEYLKEQRQIIEAAQRKKQHFPESPRKDVLLFLLKHAPLNRWQTDVLSIIREEAYYYAPQAQTKIMNEGWACFWHSRTMTGHVLTDADVVDYADHHSGTVAMRPGQLNPYKIGLELFRNIEERWNKGRFGKDWLDCEDAAQRHDWDTGAGLGLEKVFQVRQTHNDITFIDNFLTEDFCRDNGLFAYEYDKRSKQFLIDSRQFAVIKQKLLFMLSNRGEPRIMVTDGNHGNRGELELTHQHEGVDIQVDWASGVLANLSRIWGRPVHLVTALEDTPAVLSHDGDEFKVQRNAGTKSKS